MHNNRTAILMLLASAFFWSTSGVLIKLVALPPLAIAGWRCLIGAVAMLVFCRKSIRISLDRDTLIASVCMGLFCICFVGATKLGTAANAIVLQYSASAYVAVLAPWIIGEPTNRRDWFFLVLVVTGICLFFLDDLSMSGFSGILLGIAGSIFWAGTNIYLRKSRENSTSWALTLGCFIAAALCSPFLFQQMPDSAEIFGLLGLGVVCIGAGYAVFSRAIQHVTALDAVLICSVEPFFNPLWVFLFTGETPGPWGFVGAFIVLGSVTARGIIVSVNSRNVPATA